MRFDNLTGDASLDWVANAAPTILSAEWNGAARTVALLAGTVRDGYLLGASRLAHGYFETRAGKLWFRVVIEDARRHSLTAGEAAAGDALSAITAIARRIEPAAHDFSTANVKALDEWGHANFEQAVSTDPDFSAAWLTWVETLAASGNRERALEVGGRALMQSGLRSPLDRSRIELVVATLRRDDNTRIAALGEIARLSPLDAGAVRAFAQANFAARRFAEAERAYKELIALDPTDPASLNTLGYVQALAGETEEAQKSFEQYGRSPGQSVNAQDSVGEALMLNGKFADAEKAFLAGYRENPGFLDGAALWKAAHARWLGGDLGGADQLMKNYLDARSRARDPLGLWRQASWLYETGRQDEAAAVLMRSGTRTEFINQQLAVWKDPTRALGRPDLERLKELYERADPVNDGLIRTLYAGALWQSGSRDEARKLLIRWPLPQLGTSPLDSLVYPRFLDLKKQMR